MSLVQLSGLRIGVIDDNENFLRIITSVLRSFSPAEVSATSDPQKMLDDIHNGRVNFLLADQLMPSVSGLELIRQIRSAGEPAPAGLPIILMSAFAEREMIEEAVRLGADDFLRKPMRPADMFRRLVQQITDPLPRICTPRYIGPDRRERGVRTIDGVAERRTRAA